MYPEEIDPSRVSDNYTKRQKPTKAAGYSSSSHCQGILDKFMGGLYTLLLLLINNRYYMGRGVEQW